MKKTVLNTTCFILLIGGLIWLSGCRGRARLVPIREPVLEPMPSEQKLSRTGYAVQVGAFSIMDNAISLTLVLSQKGLNAYYFRHESGLYKVRFGDFPSRKAAHQKAEHFLLKNGIKDYFIVKPEDYAVSKKSLLGEDYLREKLVSTAESFLGVEYSWGSASKKVGFDCSGLIMAVYQMNGLNLPRTSKRQYFAGKSVNTAQIKKGDLVFFDTARSRTISHVGIYVGNEVFIHAPCENKTICKNSLSDSYFKKCFIGARTYLK